MTLEMTGNIIRVRGGDTHNVQDIQTYQTARIRRQGESDQSRTYEAHNATLRIETGSRFIVDDSLIMNDNAHPKIEVQDGGVLQIGGAQTLYGHEAYSVYRPVLLNLRRDTFGAGGVPQVFNEDAANLVVRNGGRVEILGAALQFQEGNLYFEGGAEFFVRDGRLYSDGAGVTDSGPNALIRTRPRVLFFGGAQSLVDIDGFTVFSSSGALNPLVFDQVPLPGIQNYRPSHCFFAVQFNGSGDATNNAPTDGTVIEVETIGNNLDILFNQVGVKTIYAYSINGAILRPGTRLTDRHQPWAVLQYVNWTYQVSDATGAKSAIVFLRDTNNGQRNFAYASGDHKPEKTYITLVPPTGEATERLIRYVFDRSLNTDPVEGTGSTSTGAGDPPVDDRSPFIGWLREYGFNQIPLRLSPVFHSAQSFFLSRNRAISLSEVEANAVTGVTIIFHSSPVSWQGLDWSITIQVTGATTEQAWHYIQAQLVKNSIVADGRLGVSLHNFWPAIANTDSALYYNPGTEGYDRRGVRVLGAGGIPLAGVLSMESDSEALYVPPISYSYTLTGLQADSEVIIRVGNDALFYIASSGAIETYTYPYEGDRIVTLQINKEGYQFEEYKGVSLGAANQTRRVEQVVSSAWTA